MQYRRSAAPPDRQADDGRGALGRRQVAPPGSGLSAGGCGTLGRPPGGATGRTDRQTPAAVTRSAARLIIPSRILFQSYNTPPVQRTTQNNRRRYLKAYQTSILLPGHIGMASTATCQIYHFIHARKSSYSVFFRLTPGFGAFSVKFATVKSAPFNACTWND